jgi:hypothetical protein
MHTSEENNPMRRSAAFLQSVFLGQESGFVVIFRKPSKYSTFAELGQEGWHTNAARQAMLSRDQENVYFAVGVQGKQPDSGRGKEGSVIALPGLWADIDAAGPNHAAANLPPTLDDAWAIARGIPFAPTLVVYTGGGLQLYWLFREPLEVSSEKDRRAAKQLSKGFQSLLAGVARRRGWAIDGTADLCRTLRLPGTYNRKQKEPVLVGYEIIDHGQRYNPSEFEEFLELERTPELKAHVQGPAPENPNAELLRIVAECPWMRHCKDDAATLPEPEWYRMLSIVGRCRDGRQNAHDLSKPYARYSVTETDEKLRQAMASAGPATCKFIESELGQAHYCARCNHQGRVKSPIVLGLPKTSRQSHDERIPTPPARGYRLPHIQVSNRQLRDVSREALQALQLFNSPPALFVRTGAMVWIAQHETGRHIITETTDLIIRNRLTKSADYYCTTEFGIRNCFPPMDVARNILAEAPGEWPFPPLRGIIEAPSLREDESLIETPGYDDVSQLFYAPGPTLVLPDIPRHPTEADTVRALDIVRDIIADFPFVDEASRTNAIASMLTAVCRPAIKGPTPLALFDATTQGTGKTLLSEVVSLIVTGREGAMFSAPREAEEWRKQITSILLEGSTITVIDNVNFRLDAPDLCKVLTETTHGDRVLGVSKTVNLPVRCTWIATGNNIQVGGDMPRRCYWIRMDAKCEKPFQRTDFKHKRLKQYVLSHRGELLGAVLTMARSWFSAGCPAPDVVPVGSFEDWTTVVGGILQHAGLACFLGNSHELYEQADIDSQQWEAFLKVLEEITYGEPFLAADIWDRMNDKSWLDHEHKTVLTERAQHLRAALPDFLAQSMDKEGTFKQRLGLALRERLGRRYGQPAVRIERDSEDTHQKVARWRVVVDE